MSAFVRRRSRRLLGFAAGAVVLGVAAAIAACPWRRDDPAPLAKAPRTDAQIERALALEAERAIRESPRDEPLPLSPDGLRALDEHWKLRAEAPAAARYVPAPIERDSVVGPRGPAPGLRGDAPPITRARPEQRGDPRVRLLSTLEPPKTPR